MKSRKIKIEEEATGNLLERELLKKETSFEKWMLKKGYSTDTAVKGNNTIEHFTRWLEKENTPLENLTYNDILHYIQSRRNKVTQSTIGKNLITIKHYCSYLENTGIIATNPATHIKVQGTHQKKLHHTLTKQELESLHNNYKIPGEKEKGANPDSTGKNLLAAKRNKVILGLIIWQGAGVGELGQLTVKDIKLREGKIYIPGGRRSNERELKLEAHQVLDIMEYTLQTRPKLLELTGSQTDKLFIGSQGGKALINTLKHLLKQLQQINPKITGYYQLRASVITHWLKLYNLREVQYMAGHRFVSSTEAYKVNDLEDLQEEIGKYHPIG